MVDRVVVVGASAGGIGPLQTLVAGLPAALPAAVLVVVHLPATADSHLPALLSRCGPLPTSSTSDGQRLTPGREEHLRAAERAQRILAAEDPQP